MTLAISLERAATTPIPGDLLISRFAHRSIDITGLTKELVRNPSR